MFLTDNEVRRRNSLKKQEGSYNDRYSQISNNTSSLSKNSESIQSDMKDKVNKFISINKRHELDEVCVCEDCIYAKQLHKYQFLKLDLNTSSTYKSQYNKKLLKRALNNTIDLSNSSLSKKSEDSCMIISKNIHMGSNYRKQFACKSLDKIQKPRPEDGLKFAGPTVGYSSYKSEYPNHQGISQYVEPLTEYILPSLKFNHSSLYSDSYKQTKVLKVQSGRLPDQLRFGKLSLINQSTSLNSFNNPNPELSLILNSNSKRQAQKRIFTPNFSYQFKTINSKDYDDPTPNKNCRNKRLQALYGQIITTGQLYK